MKNGGSYKDVERSKKKGKKKKRKESLGIGSFLAFFLLTLLGIAAVLYVGVAVYFTSHFAFNTTVNGEPAYQKTVKDLEKGVKAESSKYQLTVYGRNNVTDVISSADVSLTPEFGSEFEDILKSQNAFLWPIYLTKETNFETDTVVGYSKQNLDSLISNLKFFKAENVIAPENAYLPDEAGENGFAVVPETAGCTPIKEKVYSEIEHAVDILANEVTLSDDCYAVAEIKSDDPTLNELANNLNAYCSANIVYNFGDEQVRVDGNQIKEWCTVDGTSVSLNEELVREFVNSLSRKYDTFGKTRSLRTHDGETIDIVGGDYGWWMDRPTEAAELLEAIKSGYKGDRTPAYNATANSYGENDYGDSYVEINLTDQHLWVYKDGEVVEESDFVSGCVNKGRTTPRGAYAITYKERDATLNGENYSSAVSYWMPFNGNVGMHDASWRKEFGDEIYVTNGSHGCINLPKEKAAAIYDIMEKRYPVLVYGGKDTPEKEEPEGLTPEQQMALLIQAGILNPDGTLADPSAAGQ